MLHIEPKYIIGKEYEASTADVWLCVGYELPPDSGYPYVVGARWDQASNRTLFNTHRMKDVTFRSNCLT